MVQYVEILDFIKTFMLNITLIIVEKKKIKNLHRIFILFV